MSINLTVPHTMQELRPHITVIGVGGAGCNAINNMISADLDGVDFLVANTDGQALAHSLAPRKIQLGTNLTAGLGAGSKPDIGRQAAEESMNEVLAELTDCNMIFITAGMGGGTGTGAAPVIAKAARERGILTVGVVTKPFEFEGPRRMKQAEAGIEQLAAHVDTLIVVPNQNLFHVTNERTTFAEAFHMADAVLHQGVSGVTDLMLKPGIINLDFADIRSVMTEMGKAMMGTGEASGENKAIEAAEMAINNPLLEDSSLAGAKALIVNVTGGPELGFFEVDEAVQHIRAQVEEDANLIFGSSIDESLDGTIRVSVVATGIDAQGLSQPVPTRTPAKDITSSDLQTSTAPASEVGSFASTLAASSIMTADNAETDKTAEADASELMQTASASIADAPVETALEAQEAASAPEEVSTASDDLQLDLEGAVAAMEQAEEEASAGEPLILETIIDEAVAEEAPAEKAIDEEQASADDKPAFIPPAPLAVEPEASLETAAPVERSRPTLMRKLSGLWATSKDDEAQEAKATKAPALEEAKADEPMVLDLNRNDALQDSLPIGTNTASDSQDDELDIPAFLRRQAN